MSWLDKELRTMPLAEIEEEIKSILETSRGNLTVEAIHRLRDLKEAKQLIVGSRGMGCYR